MSNQLLEERVGVVEREQARQGEKIDVLGRQMSDANAGIKQLLERDARRPEPIGIKAVGIAFSAVASAAIVGWWLIGTAPAVRALEDRLTKLDDPQIGRVTSIEKDLAWSARVTER